MPDLLIGKTESVPSGLVVVGAVYLMLALLLRTICCSVGCRQLCSELYSHIHKCTHTNGHITSNLLITTLPSHMGGNETMSTVHRDL